MSAGQARSAADERVLERIGLSWIATLWIVAELVTMFHGKNGRSLPDCIAGTVVVRTDGERSPSPAA